MVINSEFDPMSERVRLNPDAPLKSQYLQDRPDQAPVTSGLPDAVAAVPVVPIGGPSPR